MEICFHLDENVEQAVAQGLRRRGIDVTTAEDVGLVHAADEAHLVFAHGGGRVLFTHDRDFLVMHQRGVPHSGIAYCHIQARSIGQQVRALVALHLARTAEEMKNAVEFL
jgi:predicted nuclease of predicted toxin-antitoxin system